MVNSPMKNLNKRKLKEVDSEDELFLKYEVQKKKLSLDNNEKAEILPRDETKKEPQNCEEIDQVIKTNNEAKNEEAEQTDNKTPLKENNQKSSIDSVEKKQDIQSTPVSHAKKSMVQTKISFGAVNSPKIPASTTKKETVVIKSVPNNGEWKIEDFLVDEQWKKLLGEEFEKQYFMEINKFVREGYMKNKVRPPKELVFNALNSTKLSEIKVVIIGQDPYHDDGQAHGLAFSVPVGIKLPPSLRNIFIELKSDIPDFERDESLGGCLQKWTDRGVFLLNTFLTVEAHKAGSHSKIGWDIFTDKIIKLVSENKNGCVFLLWGNFAQKKESLIDKKKHKIVKCAHPSPFSCQKFFNSKCFSQANAFLKSIRKTPLNWSLK